MGRFACSSRRWSCVAAVLVVIAVFVVAWRSGPPVLAGDGPEYYHMLESLAAHGSAEQRPSDAARVDALLRANGYPTLAPHNGYFPDSSGRWYCYHFWAYSLAAVPAKFLLRAAHANEMHAFFVTNALLVVMALAVALGASGLSRQRAVVFTVLAVLSPVVWYIRWPHAEVFMWAFVVLGLSLLRHRAWSSLCFAIASVQAVPIALLAWIPPLLAARERKFAVASRASAAALVSAVPMVFYFLHFRTPNPIGASGLADPHLIGLGRLSSFFFDLDQGVLVHAPATFLLGCVGAAFAARARALDGIALMGAIVVMAAVATSTVNWNAGCSGMLRYGVWTLPAFAWLAARWLPASRAWVAPACALGGVQLVHLGPRPADDSIEHSPLATWVLDHVPAFWNPDPENFVERTLHRPTDDPWIPFPLPVGHAREGKVTKLLVDPPSLAFLEQAFDVSPAYATELRARSANRRGTFYVEPPDGAVRVREGASPPLRPAIDDTVVVSGDGWYPEYREGPIVVVCSKRRGTLRLTTDAREHLLSMRFWPPVDVLQHPVEVRFFADGHELDRIRFAFSRATRTWSLPSGAKEITVELSETASFPGYSDFGLCIDAIHWR